MIDFLGLGAQKSATSWLFQCLREHPEICLADEKEIHYFSNDDIYACGHLWYESHWESCTAHQRKGEISTSYLSSPDAPARIKEYAPHAKLIALLRNPIDRAESHIRHLLSKSEISEHMSLTQMLAARPDIFENGTYATHLERYFALFPKEQMYIETYDAVLADPLAVITGVDAFLGIDSHIPKTLHMRYNSSAFRASSFHTTANKTHQSLKKTAGGRAILRGLKSIGITSSKFAHLGHMIGKQSNTLYKFSPEDRRILAERYAREIQKLADYGIAFNSSVR